MKIKKSQRTKHRWIILKSEDLRINLKDFLKLSPEDRPFLKQIIKKDILALKCRLEYLNDFLYEVYRLIFLKGLYSIKIKIAHTKPQLLI